MPITRAAKELAGLLAAVAHPLRLRLVEALGSRQLIVTDLIKLTASTQSAVSQQLSILRDKRVVIQRREGRHVYYRLARPQLAPWLARGLRFVELDRADSTDISHSIARARALWTRAKSHSRGAR